MTPDARVRACPDCCGGYVIDADGQAVRCALCWGKALVRILPISDRCGWTHVHGVLCSGAAGTRERCKLKNKHDGDHDFGELCR